MDPYPSRASEQKGERERCPPFWPVLLIGYFGALDTVRRCWVRIVCAVLAPRRHSLMERCPVRSWPRSLEWREWGTHTRRKVTKALHCECVWVATFTLWNVFCTRAQITAARSTLRPGRHITRCTSRKAILLCHIKARSPPAGVQIMID